MKKKSVLVVIVAFVLVMLAGCGEAKQESEYVGAWQATTAELSDVTVNVEDVYGVMTLTFDKNGTVTITTKEDEATDSWEENDDGVVIQSDGQAIPLKRVKDNVLAGDFGGITLSFERVDEE